MRCVAFLRAINVGGRTIRMAELVALFETSGLCNVMTFLASGNVMFDNDTGFMDYELEKRLEEHIQKVFGFSSEVFIRTSEEICTIALHKPFESMAVEPAPTNCVGFTRSVIPDTAEATLRSISSERDTFCVKGREIYWSSLNRQSEASFTLRQLERALNVKCTFRGVNTIARLAQRCA